MTDSVPSVGARRARIEFIDILRAVALLAMAVYHFTWDLDFHGLVAHGTATDGGWRLFARGIAASFLFLVGISLVLAHGRAIRWRSFWIREAQVLAGAVAITLVTSFITPESFVFFGILHQIALASLVGLLFLRLPPLLTGVLGIGIIVTAFHVATPLTDPRWLAWIGLTADEPRTNDYVPFFPWTGVVLIGIAAAGLAERWGVPAKLARLNTSLRPLRALGWLGRHSLLFYLLHQPILFGLVAGYVQIFPPDQVKLFAASCRHECRKDRDGPTCEAFCGCVETDLAAKNILERLIAGTTSEAENATVRRTVLQCSFPGLPVDP
ncbi:hypothetical protein GCM10011390_05490 [Aureimonas endophytica]|uniref:Heparan-alpha-glucosaminide N-acetyltransferase catalytic domain-containing protein n=1 Tax=Aureimonas endophytica TaxID=2027858 RepID=A0A916ZE86_9HYPH|nr:heparan-alpha-glucosaminide N-acetyltransferase [Aureimonas endophytica]GGD89609.1 hypothetical protein GCM10011390_05490 [Aureimonas endophytica]